MSRTTNPLIFQSSRNVVLVVVLKLCCVLCVYTKADYSDLVQWTAIGTNQLPTGRYEVCTSSDGRISAAAKNSGYMYYSHDYAQTWHQTSVSCSFLGVDCSQTGQYIIAVCYTANSLLVSNDYGVSWSRPVFDQFWYAAVSPDGAHMMATACQYSSGNNQLYTSNNFGVTFSVSYTGSACGEFMAVKMDPGGRAYLYPSVSSPYQVLQSLNYGSSWTELTALTVTDSDARIMQVQFDQTGKDGFAFSTKFNYCKYTRDSGATWQLSQFPVNDTCGALVSMGIGLDNSKYVTVACYYGFLYSSNDYGATFVANSPVPNDLTYWLKMDANDEGTFLLVSTYGGPVYVGYRGMLPTAAPSARVTCPTIVPSLSSISPSMSPTRAPTMVPTEPTALPSFSPTQCPLGTFEVIDGGCLNCPQNSFTELLGATTCTCKAGYEPFGFGDTLVCTECAPGHFSNVGENCSACAAGYAPVIDLSSCQICPLNTYAKAAAADCTACGDGLLTPAPGATSAALCVSPATNFVIGFIALAVIIFTGCFYIGSGRFIRIAIKRRNHVLFPLVDMCQRRAAEIFARMNRKKDNNLRAPVKVFIFIIFGTFLIGVMSVALYVLYVYIVLINAMILWRGFGYKLELNFLDAVSTYLTLLSRVLGTPIAVEFLFYPLVFLFKKLAMLRIDLVGSLSVTCEGSQGTGRLLIDVLIFGLVVIFIQADYEIFWSTTLHSVQRCSIQKIVRKLPTLSNISERIKKLLVVFLIGMMSLVANPFQIFLRYLMGFIDFSFLGGFSQSTPECDAMPHARSIDTVLGYATFLLIWSLILPIMYVISNIMIPCCHQYVAMRLKNQNYVYPNVPVELSALNYICGRSAVTLPVKPTSELKITGSLKTKLPLSGKAWYFILSWISPDMFVARFADIWVAFLFNEADWRDEENWAADEDLDKLSNNRYDDASFSYKSVVTTDTSNSSSIRGLSTRLVRVVEQHSVYELPALIKSDRSRPKPLSRRTNFLYGGMSGLSQANIDVDDPHFEEDIPPHNIPNNSNDLAASVPVTEDCSPIKCVEQEDEAEQFIMTASPEIEMGPVHSAPQENEVMAIGCSNSQELPALLEEDDLTKSQRPGSDNFAIYAPFYSINESRDFPAYFDLCASEFNELFPLVTAITGGTIFLPMIVRVFVTFIAVYLLGMGHISTVVGREHLKIVIWKFWAFICVCFGFWNNDNSTVDAFHLCGTWHPGKISRIRADGTCDVDYGDGSAEARVDVNNVVSLVNEQGQRVGWDSSARGSSSSNDCGPAESVVVALVGDPVVALRNSVTSLENTFMITENILTFQVYDREICHQNMTRLISAVVGIRAILLMIFWNGTVASVFFVLTCETPLFVRSQELKRKLPPLFITSPMLMGEQRERQILVNRWGNDILANIHGKLTGYRRFRVLTRCFIICVTQGRFLNWFFNAYTFGLSLLVIMLNTSSSIYTPLLLLVRLPYILGQATLFVLRFGEILQLDNSDFEKTWSLICHLCGRQHISAPVSPQSTEGIIHPQLVTDDEQNNEVVSQP